MAELVFRQTDTAWQRRAARLLRDVAAPLLGMSMFWPMLRYASFVRVLFPPEATVSLAGTTLTAHAAFLCLLVAVTVGAYLLRAPLARFMAQRWPACAAAMAMGAPGAALALCVREGMAPAQLLWPAGLLAAVGILACYLCWARWLSQAPTPRATCMVVASFLLSYACFSYSVPLGSFLGSAAGSVVTPLGTALLWLASGTTNNAASPKVEEASRTGGPSLTQARPLLLAIGSGLVVGAAVRGIVDLTAPISSVRLATSLAINAAWLAAALGLCVVRGRAGRADNAGRDFVERFSLISWAGFALVFLAGLFAFLALGQTRLGGDLVVASRTAMSIALLMLLCSLAPSLDAADRVKLLLKHGFAIEVASWLLSYVVIPRAIGPDARGTLTPQGFVLAVLFGAVALLLAGFALRLAFSHSGMGTSDMPGKPARDGIQGTEPGNGAACVAAGDQTGRLVAEGLLTPREAAVVALYSQGLSLGKVAEELCITKSTAQSHIKNAYRKLDVHSRDELIERLRP